MSAEGKRILEEARALSPEERRSIGLELLEDDDGTLEEVEQAWIAEVERRMADVRAGRSELIPLAKAMQMLGKRQPP
ncbi:MAG: addiction module protein [Polyangiaceae bacterium]|nr:addiction module protein [Polyangiaceae bacterium]